MAKKADAWRDYQEAAMIDMMLDTLPKVIQAVKQFLMQCCSFRYQLKTIKAKYLT